MNFCHDLSPEILIESAIRSFLGFIWATGLVIGWSMAVTFHAQIMNNATGIYIILLSAITWAKQNKYDLIGYGIWIISATIVILDPLAIKMDSNEPSIIGAIISLIRAGFGSLLTFIGHNKKSPHLIITKTQFYLFSVIYQLVIFLIFANSQNFYTMDQAHETFGWLSNIKNLVIVLCIVSPLIGVLEKLIYFATNSYFLCRRSWFWLFLSLTLDKFSDFLLAKTKSQEQWRF